MIVIAKPIQVTIVKEEPFSSVTTFCATRVENKGESAITAILHTSKKRIKTINESFNKKRGEIRQHRQEIAKDKVATFLVPNLLAIRPLITQEILPLTMIINDNRELFNCR